MALTTYKPLVVYGVAMIIVGIAASVFQSAEMMRVCVVAYIVGWAVFLINVGKER